MSRSYEGLLSRPDSHFFVRAVADLTTDQNEKKQAEHKIKADEAKQGENGVAVAHYLAVAVARVKEAVDQPWLASQFGSHPAQCIGNVWIGKRQHQHPQQPGVRA